MGKQILNTPNKPKNLKIQTIILKKKNHSPLTKNKIKIII